MDIAQQWANALRSDKYKRGRRKLRSSDDCFCPLGVLCDISELGFWRPEGRFHEYVISHHGVEYTSPIALPAPVAQWAGIEGWDGTYVNNPAFYLSKGVVFTVVDANDEMLGDSYQYQWSQIADLIDEYWAVM